MDLICALMMNLRSQRVLPALRRIYIYVAALPAVDTAANAHFAPLCGSARLNVSNLL